ncbi:MAG: hypothetical protein DI538_17745 [Azospira oryzae]|jgi:hypothetical protein|nr:MAG: hypothetical protein DI538_17745 [Azospira oryzae]
MLLIAMAASLMGFYFLYTTSTRADLRKDKVSRWLQRQPWLSKTAGVCSLLLSYILFIATLGTGAGALFASVALMTSGSLIILLSPLIKTD